MRDVSTFTDLSGSVAVVTGAAGGLGRGIARELSAAGAAVVVHYRTATAAAHDLTRELQSMGGHAISACADITSFEACEELMRIATDEFGGLDILVNNAGVQPVQPLSSMSVEQWRTVVDVNVTGTFASTQAAAAVMQARGGAIIHIASIEGRQPAHNHAHYSAAKAAVIMHARAAALEYGRWGIRVNSVSPGLINRPGLNQEWAEGVERWTAAAPLGRLGEPRDVGQACVFLASSGARWITGHDLVVDGGVSVNPSW